MKDVRPPVEEWVNLVLSGSDVDHDVRFNMVTVLKYLGWSKEDVIKLIMEKAKWSDKIERIVRYQVEHIYRKGYSVRTEVFNKLFRDFEIPKYR